MSESTSYPNVPDAPGVPNVPREPGASATQDAQTPITADGNNLSGFHTAQWGIFDASGNPVIVADSVLTFDFRQEYRVSDYAVEQGGFQSYNKVATPYDAKIAYTIGGSVADRAEFLNSVNAVVASMDLYSIVTPEITYQSANVLHQDYRRTSADGVTMLTVEVWLEEIRVTGTAQFSSTKEPAGASTTNGGTVQPTTPPASAPAETLFT